ncbi:hypothetical protein DFJ43DRAFT_1208724 [Lentinula guzmanii]|uniref:RRM domain-containing protein n=1 Tax=Lentinula guzmanii TaxID=2804957 RepID=A0AA38JAJ4_9AGAR|nr:hypothetical protein DFJ43DRAFT_1208724 [Lentinula guzmanii]
MFSFGLRSALHLRSTSLRLQNAARLPATSFFAFRSLSTSFVNHGPSSRFVYLGNLPWSLEIEEIKDKAEKFGTLVSINMPDTDGRPAGFSNIEFSSPEEANSFYRAANETSLSFRGRKARVEIFDEPQKEVVRSNRQQNPPSNTIFIGRIPFDANEDDLQEMFSSFGNIQRIDLSKDPSRRFGHVQYESVEEASAAMSALNNEQTTLLGQRIHLDFAPPKAGSAPSNQLYFSGFNGTLKDMEAALYQQSGVSDVIMLKNRNGILKFKSVEEAAAAKQALDRTQTPDGHTLNLYFSNPRPKPTDNRSRSGNMRRSNSYGNDW